MNNSQKNEQKQDAEVKIPARPKALEVFPENINYQLKDLNQWVCWRYEWNADKGNYDKMLYNAKNAIKYKRRAKSNDPDTWSDFETALKRYQDNRLDYDGIGFVLQSDNGIVGIDLDHCIDDGNWSDFAQTMLKVICSGANYAEISPSGTGLRMFCGGSLPGKGRKNEKLEIYADVRFLTITGHKISKYDMLMNHQPVIDAIIAKQFGDKKTADPKPVATQKNDRPAPSLDDANIIKKVMRNADTKKLWNGDESIFTKNKWLKADGSPDWSRGDQSLCSKIARYTDDAEQIDRVFRESELNREKWESRKDYRQTTINNALASRSQYEGSDEELKDLERAALDQIGEWDEPGDDKPLSDDPEIAEMLTEVMEQTDKPKAPLLRWRDLKAIAERQKNRWIVEDLIDSGTLQLFSGLPYSGKTTVINTIMSYIASGRDFLGKKVCRVPILYINADAFSEKLIVRNVQKAMVDAVNDDELQDVFFSPPNGEMGQVEIDADYLAGRVAEIRQILADEKPDGVDAGKILIVIDTLRSALLAGAEAGSENDSTTMTSKLKPLREWAGNTGSAIMLLHHNAKGSDRYAGSAGIAGCTSGVWTISKPEMGTTSTLKIVTREDYQHEFKLVMSDNGIVLAADRVIDDAEVSELEMLPKSEPLDLQEICDCLQLTRTSAQRWISEALVAGDLIRSGRGTRHEPYQYMRL